MPQGLYFNSLKIFQHLFIFILIASFPTYTQADEDSLNNIHQKLMEANSLKLQADHILSNSNESITQQHLQAYSLLYQSHTLKQQVYASMLNQLVNQDPSLDSLTGVSATILKNVDRLSKSSATIIAHIETHTLDNPTKIVNYQQACNELSLASTGYQIIYDTLQNNNNDSCLVESSSEQYYGALSLKYNQSINSISSLFAISNIIEDEIAQPLVKINQNQPSIKVETSENIRKNQLVFAIQLAASRGQLNPDLLAPLKRKTKGNLQEVKEGQWYKYHYIVGPSYSETHQMWLHFGSDVCFPVAYYKGEKISMQKALAMCERK